MGKKNVTLRDIAAVVGVTANTVSRALRDSHEISEPMKQKIRKVANELGYIPNYVASSLKVGRTNLIAVVFDSMINPYFTIMTGIIQSYFQKYDYDIMIYSTNKPYLDSKAYKIILGRKIDGVVTFVEPTNDVIELSNKNNFPIILVGSKMKQDLIDTYITDDVKGGYLACETLIKAGCQRIAYVSFETMGECALRRLEGYKQCLKDYGLSEESEDVILIKDLQHLNEDIIKHLLRYDGIFCFNDMIAFELSFYLSDHTIKIVGYDNLQNELFSVNMLTSVSYKKEDIARAVVKRMLNRIEQKKKEFQPRSVEFDVSIVFGKNFKE